MAGGYSFFYPDMRLRKAEVSTLNPEPLTLNPEPFCLSWMISYCNTMNAN